MTIAVDQVVDDPAVEAEFVHPSWCSGEDCSACRARLDAEYRREAEARGWNAPYPAGEAPRLGPCFACGQPTPNCGRCIDCEERVHLRRPHP